MKVQDMHYDFKMKFNKIDSQKNRNLQIPEIDWILNEAEKIFVKLVAYPRKFTHLGFEVNQRSTEDIRNIVVSKKIPVNSSIGISAASGNRLNGVVLPVDYEMFLRGRCLITKGKCVNKEAVFIPVQHDDPSDLSENYSSSFDWREVIGNFDSLGIQLLVKDFFVSEFTLSYIRKREYICFPSGVPGGTYKLPGSSVALSENQNSELAEVTHNEIVDIAVMLAAGKIQASDFQIRMNKLSVNQLL